ncbi:MAG: penicillin-binding protein 1A [Solirubrobacteraceae bacterium]
MQNNPNTFNNTQQVKKYIRLFWLSFISFIIFLILFFWAASAGFLGSVPDITELDNPDLNLASEVYSSDGKLLERFEEEKRIPIEYKNLPEYLVNALLAKEDIRFREHTGVDMIAILRAATGGGGGGSTITQQLSKQLYTGERSKFLPLRLKQKLLEWITAVGLERRYTKDEIITMYFNKFDFLFGANGIEAASKIYFNKETKDLTLSEAAMFVGMFQNPVQINPLKNMPLAIEKRNGVLNKMAEHGFITIDEARRVSKQPIILDFNRKRLKSIKESYSAYFKYFLKKEVAQILENYEKETGKKYNLYKDGLKIHTTIDSRMQLAAEGAIKKHLKKLQSSFFAEQRNNSLAPFNNISKEKRDRILFAGIKQTSRYRLLKNKNLSDANILNEFKKPIRLEIYTWSGIKDTLMSPLDSIIYHKHIVQSGLLSIDPGSGNIKAWVGGINWDYFKFDHVKQSRRQAGSTFKPFVYLTAINQMNLTPCSTVSNEQLTVGKWSPRNSSGRYGGSLTLRNGLAFSVNTISARLIQQTTPPLVIQLVREMGITSPIENDLTISLGSSDLTLYEMVGAYSVFANNGIYIKPELILKIEDSKGAIIKEYNLESREVISEEVAYSMVDLLKGVVDFGTGVSLRGYGDFGEVAGKTGTTNDNSDGWFIGMVPKLVTGIWTGWDDRFAHFRSTNMGQGASMAMPIWAYYMNSVYEINGIDLSRKDKFEKPSSKFKLWECNNNRHDFETNLISEESGIVSKPTIYNQTSNNSKTENKNSEPKEEIKINFN